MPQIKDLERKKLELTLSEIQKIAKNYGKLSKLSICGGEPFLRDDVADIVQTFIDHCEVRIIDIPTNGSLPNRIYEKTEIILKRNPHLNLEIQLSIDGPKATHDKLRNFPGLFEKMIQTYQALSGLKNAYPNLRIKMNLVYQEGNEDVLAEMVKEFDQKYRFDRFQITFPHGDALLQDKIARLSYKKFYRLSKRIQLNMKIRFRLDIHSLIFRAIKILGDENLLQIIDKKNMGEICHAGSRIVVLDDIGGVFPCEPLWEKVGNIRDFQYDMKQVLAARQMTQFKEKYLGPGKCHCTWSCVVLDNIISNPILYPQIIYYMLYLILFAGRGFKE